MADRESEVDSHGRFRHRSARKHDSKRGNAGPSPFQPSNMLGKYTLRSKHCDEFDHSNPDRPNTSVLEIHEIVGRQRNGYLASFVFGSIHGVMLLAGSRRGLRDLVDEMEEDEEDEEEDESTAGSSDVEEDQDGNHEAAENIENQGFLNAADLPSSQTSHAFEKNTFRNPKWFARWRGTRRRSLSQESIPDSGEQETSAEHTAHFEFTSAACKEFQMTFTDPVLGTRNMPFQGWKMTNKPSAALYSWGESFADTG